MDGKVFGKQHIDEQTLMDCSVFAGLAKDNYDKRGQKDELRKREQRFFGKVGEWVAHAAIRPYFTELSYPNMEIFSPKEKSWDNDLYAGEVAFACKTCEWNGDSWLFQLKDDEGHGCDKEIFATNAKDKLVVCVQLDFDKHSGRIRSLIPLSQVKSLNLFEDPRKIDLRGKKLVVYRHALSYYGFLDKIHPSVEEFLHKVQV